MGGQRTTNNCYGVKPSPIVRCNRAKLDEVDVGTRVLNSNKLNDILVVMNNIVYSLILLLNIGHIH
jgi:hypothetical protein